jgi:phenylalanyl-tRNA synthetase beta chain
MLVSWNWLSDYVSPDASISDVTDRLTMSGLNLEETQAVASDTCIDLEVTSNRADCLGHIGVAREIAALYGVGLCVPEPSISDTGPNIAEQTSVAIECEDLCEEYHARLIRGVRIGPSPDWLVERLKTIGVTSVNNVVDVTNYVMFECGQPLHAFDFNTLDDERIVVRRAVAKETIVAIDQKQYELPEGACVIADGSRAVAVAGVMGGLDTEISDRTTDVLIEAASFDPVSVRTTARTLKLHSPSSYRFERRVDRCQLDWASKRCCELILQVAGGELQSGSIVAGHPSSLLTARTIRLRFAQVERLLGISIDRDECLAILRRLGIECVEAQPDAASFLSPSWRADLTRECDLIEEIARVHGYDKIPDDAALPVVATHRSVREHVLDTMRHVLTACGISEAMTLSFVSAELRQAIQPRGDIAPVSVDHSSRSHENQLRQSLIPSLLHSRRLNERHGNANVSLFEVAKVYLSADKQLSESAAEPTVLGIVSGGGFARLKGIVASLVQTLAPSATLETRRESAEFMAPGRGAGLFLDGERLGWIAELGSDTLKKLELQDAAVAAELDLHLLENAYQPARTYQPLPRFPSVTRDLNFVIPESVSWQELRDAVESAAGDQLQQIEFAGQYRGNQIGADHKSYVVTCRFSADDRTLKADEVDSAVTSIVAACEQQLQATLRS